MEITGIVPPVVIREVGDPEFIFYPTLADVLNNRDDVLWGEQYDAWDSAGHWACIKRVHPDVPWWKRLFGGDWSFLRVESLASADQRNPTKELVGFLEQHCGVRMDANATVGELIQVGLKVETARQEKWNAEH